MLSFRLGTYKTFPALLSYHAIFFIYNLLTEGYLNTSTDTVNSWNICKNILDGPLMLTFLAYFSTSALFTKKLKIGLAIMVSYEIVIVSVKGFTTDAITLILLRRRNGRPLFGDTNAELHFLPQCRREK